LTRDDYERLRQGLLRIPEERVTVSIGKEDFIGACAVFLLVFLSTFPVVIPFIVFRDVHVALRASNAVAIAMMFMAGYWLARHGGYHPWRTGASVAALGVALVGIAIALGG
jgi:VIT1/CCC1 family predicted Fe2+/Mn2+ transporter